VVEEPRGGPPARAADRPRPAAARDGEEPARARAPAHEEENDDENIAVQQQRQQQLRDLRAVAAEVFGLADLAEPEIPIERAAMDADVRVFRAADGGEEEEEGGGARGDANAPPLIAQCSSAHEIAYQVSLVLWFFGTFALLQAVLLHFSDLLPSSHGELLRAATGEWDPASVPLFGEASPTLIEFGVSLDVQIVSHVCSLLMGAALLCSTFARARARHLGVRLVGIRMTGAMLGALQRHALRALRPAAVLFCHVSWILLFNAIAVGAMFVVPYFCGRMTMYSLRSTSAHAVEAMWPIIATRALPAVTPATLRNAPAVPVHLATGRHRSVLQSISSGGSSHWADAPFNTSRAAFRAASQFFGYLQTDEPRGIYAEVKHISEALALNNSLCAKWCETKKGFAAQEDLRRTRRGNLASLHMLGGDAASPPRPALLGGESESRPFVLREYVPPRWFEATMQCTPCGSHTTMAVAAVHALRSRLHLEFASTAAYVELSTGLKVRNKVGVLGRQLKDTGRTLGVQLDLLALLRRQERETLAAMWGSDGISDSAAAVSQFHRIQARVLAEYRETSVSRDASPSEHSARIQARIHRHRHSVVAWLHSTLRAFIDTVGTLWRSSIAWVYDDRAEWEGFGARSTANESNGTNASNASINIAASDLSASALEPERFVREEMNETVRAALYDLNVVARLAFSQCPTVALYSAVWGNMTQNITRARLNGTLGRGAANVLIEAHAFDGGRGDLMETFRTLQLEHASHNRSFDWVDFMQCSGLECFDVAHPCTVWSASYLQFKLQPVWAEAGSFVRELFSPFMHSRFDWIRRVDRGVLRAAKWCCGWNERMWSWLVAPLWRALVSIPNLLVSLSDVDTDRDAEHPPSDIPDAVPIAVGYAAVCVILLLCRAIAEKIDEHGARSDSERYLRRCAEAFADIEGDRREKQAKRIRKVHEAALRIDIDVETGPMYHVVPHASSLRNAVESHEEVAPLFVWNIGLGRWACNSDSRCSLWCCFSIGVNILTVLTLAEWVGIVAGWVFPTYIADTPPPRTFVVEHATEMLRVVAEAAVSAVERREWSGAWALAWSWVSPRLNGAWDRESNDFAPHAVVLAFVVVVLLLLVDNTVARVCCRQCAEKAKKAKESEAVDKAIRAAAVVDGDSTARVGDESERVAQQAQYVRDHAEWQEQVEAPVDDVPAEPPLGAAAADMLPGDDAPAPLRRIDEGDDAFDAANFPIIEATIGAFAAVGAVAKLLALLAVKMVIFPFWIGACLDLGALPYLGSSTHAALATRPFSIEFVGISDAPAAPTEISMASCSSDLFSSQCATAVEQLGAALNVSAAAMPLLPLASIPTVSHFASEVADEHFYPVFVASLFARRAQNKARATSGAEYNTWGAMASPFEFSAEYNASGIRECPPGPESWCKWQNLSRGVSWCMGNCTYGDGVLLLPSGFVHTGTFAHGAANGSGFVAQLSSVTGKERTAGSMWLQGTWHDGVAYEDGFARVRSPSGDIYAGGWHGGAPHGAGLVLKQLGAHRRAFITKSTSHAPNVRFDCRSVDLACHDADCSATSDSRWVALLRAQLASVAGGGSGRRGREWRDGVRPPRFPCEAIIGDRTRRRVPARVAATVESPRRSVVRSHRTVAMARAHTAAIDRAYLFITDKLQGATEKLVLMETLPLCSMLLHWFVGMSFMLVVTVVVLQLRESLHPDVLAPFIHPPHDDEEMLRLLLLESNATHAKRVIVSAAIYLGSVVLFAIAPFVLPGSRLAPFLAGDFPFVSGSIFGPILPLRLCYDHAFAPIVIPCEVVVLHYCLVKILDQLKSSAEVLFEVALPVICGWFDIERIVLPIPDPAAAPPAEGEKPTLLPRERPRNFFCLVRCALAAAVVWLMLVAVSSSLLLTPLLIGRATTVITLRIVCPHDPLAFVIGALFYVPSLPYMTRALNRAARGADGTVGADAADVAAAELKAEPLDVAHTPAATGATDGPYALLDFAGRALRRVASPVFLIAVGAAASQVIGLEGGLPPLRFTSRSDGALIGAIVAAAAAFHPDAVQRSLRIFHGTVGRIRRVRIPGCGRRCDLFLCELVVCITCGVIGARAVITLVRKEGEVGNAALQPAQPVWPFTAMRPSSASWQLCAVQWVQEWALGAFAFVVARVGLQMRCAFQRDLLLFRSLLSLPTRVKFAHRDSLLPFLPPSDPLPNTHLHVANTQGSRGVGDGRVHHHRRRARRDTSRVSTRESHASTGRAAPNAARVAIWRHELDRCTARG
jgi:hypothetical protein